MIHFQRLTAQDLSMIWADDFGWPEDIGAIAILEGKPLFDATGRLKIEEVRAHIERRLHLVPRFRQILHRPQFGLGWPLWVDAPAFELRDHVQVLPLASDNDSELLSACEELRRQPLDRSRPLWEMWFLPSMQGERVAVFFKVHHAMADGMAGVAALGAFMDAEPLTTLPVAQSWTSRPIPSSWDLLRENVRRHVQAFVAAMIKLAHPITTVRRLRRAWPAVREAFGEGPAPRVSLNGRVGPHRRLAILRGSLEHAKVAAHANDAKVNDVLLAAVAGGLRDLLLMRKESVNVPVRAFVPVSLHQDPGLAQGNVDGAMVVPLPIGDPDATPRLRCIAAETRERKKKARPQAGTIFRNGLIQRAFLRYAPHQRMVNVYVANVPGPPVPLYFAGARVREVFPVIPIIGNIALGIGALSYAGQLNVTVVADRERFPDLDVFVQGLQRSVDALAATIRVRSA
jgi:diacylglycerol O-acyltransferase / wax synthase